MAQAENDKTLRPVSLGTLEADEQLRRTVRRAGRQMDLEQNRSVITIARALEQIDDVESRADLQTRMAQLEERLERLASRPAVDQEVESQLKVLRTTIESALEAIAAPPAGPAAGAAPLHWPPRDDELEALRKEFEARLLEARSDLRYEILRVEKDLAATPSGTLAVDELRTELLARIEQAETRAAEAVKLLEASIEAQRAALARERTSHVEVMARLSRELANFSRSLAGAGPAD
ncbi:MAG TPA: hypothetical protein VHL54_00695 [Actinomycetota bacterium]|nr:hypothetical protein [Actinomycetota bacterium]